MKKTPTAVRAALPQRVRDAGVRFMLPSLVDMHVVSKSKMVPFDHDERMMAGSELCTGAARDGVPQEIHDEEVSAGEPHSENLYLKTPAELDRLGIRMLPRTLEEAISAFAADPLGRSAFGDAMYDSRIGFKREEWASHTTHVSDWEKSRYLKFF